MDLNQQRVKEFHQATGLPVRVTPELDKDQCALRCALVAEELEEFDIAMAAGNLVDIADALGDLLYVVYGAAVTFGIDLAPVFTEIHRSNMTKIGPDGIKKRADGKILKPATYEPPNLKPIIQEQMIDANPSASNR